MHAGIGRDELQHIIQSMLIGRPHIFKSQRQLIRRMEHLPDLRFTHGSIDIGQLVINGLYQSAKSFCDPRRNFLRGNMSHITIHINRGFLQVLCKIQFGIGITLAHLNALGLFDRFIFCQLFRCVQTQKLFNLQILPDLIQKCRIIWQGDQYFALLSGNHTQCQIVAAALIPGCKDADTDIIVLIRFIRPVINGLIEAERIPAVERRVTVLLIGEDILKDHLRNLIDYLCHFNILAVDFAVDLLFFICQEDIVQTILLHQHLTHQDLECFFNMLFYFDAIIVDIFNHQAGDIINVGFNLQDILDHEQGFQHIDGKDIALLMVRIDIVVVICPDDDPLMTMIQEVLQSIIETMERYDRADIFIFQRHSRLFEQSQHRTLTLGQVLSGSAVRTDRSKNACKQIELIRNERIYFSKVPLICI